MSMKKMGIILLLLFIYFKDFFLSLSLVSRRIDAYASLIDVIKGEPLYLVFCWLVLFAFNQELILRRSKVGKVGI
jgi:hypothetical protein